MEEQALAQFVKQAPSLPRYRQLLNLDQSTLSTQAEQNSDTGAVIIAQLHERQNQQVYESLHSISDLLDAYMMSWPYGYSNGDKPVAYPVLATDSRFAAYRDFMAKQTSVYDSETADAANSRLNTLKSFVAINGTANDRQRFAVATPFSYLDSYRSNYQPFPPPPRTDLGIPLADMMTYFDDGDSFRLPGLYYLYWLANHPEVQPLPINNSLGKIPVRAIDGFAYANLLSNAIIGTEDSTAYGAGYLTARNYSSFDELYEWVPLPLKQYSWDEFSSEPVLAAAVDGVQKAYISILKNSPALKLEKPDAFVAMKSWSPENLKEFKKILAKGI